MTTTIETLRDASENAWDATVETAGLGPDGEQDADTVERAETARDAAMDAWDAAIETDDDADAVEHLETAAALGREWGDDSHERRAIELVRGRSVKLATEEQIRALRDEAAEAGDMSMVTTCDRAIRGDEDACCDVARVITDAQAQDPTAYGYTFESWLRAAGRRDSASEYDLRGAWRAGEEPSEYAV